MALEKLAPASTPVCLSTKCGGRRCVLQESIPQRRMRVAPMYALPSSGGKHPNPGDKRLPRVRPILDATGLGCELAHCAQCCGGRSSYSRGRSDIPAGPYLTPALRRPNGDHWVQHKGGSGVVAGPRGVEVHEVRHRLHPSTGIASAALHDDIQARRGRLRLRVLQKNSLLDALRRCSHAHANIKPTAKQRQCQRSR